MSHVGGRESVREDDASPVIATEWRRLETPCIPIIHASDSFRKFSGTVRARAKGMGT